MAKGEGQPILIVGDVASAKPLAARLQKQGYRCRTAPDGASAMAQVALAAFHLAVSDLDLPDMAGAKLVEELRHRDAKLVVIALAASGKLDVAADSLRAGAFTYLLKPVPPNTLTQAVERALEHRKTVHEKGRSREVSLVLRPAIEALVHALEAKDEYSEGHSRRVAQLAVALGQHVGLPPEEVDNLHLAALLHDVGNIGLREGILSKPDRLTLEEYDHVKTHIGIAARILEPIEGLKPLIPIICHHHERYDGLGYPDSLRSEKIPLGARILALADVYDALISPRPYRQAFSAPMALAIIEGNAGTQFDPQLARDFVAMLRHLLGEAAPSPGPP